MIFRIADFGLRIAMALVLLPCASAACRAQACYIDPVTGQQICAQSAVGWKPPIDLERNPQSENRNPQSQTASAHCRITVSDGSTGSGTLVGRSQSLGLVLTCAHLFDNATGRIIVSFRDGQRCAAVLIERDRAHDLAALMIRRPNAEPINVSDEDPTGVLAACGFGGDGQLRCFRGNVTGQATAIGAAYPSLTIAGAARPGDSGGGVLNTSGQLVGVVWGQRDGLTYATCGRPVREFLKRILGQTDRQAPAPPAVQSPDINEPPTSHEFDSHIRARFESLEERLKQVASSRVGFFQGLSFGKLLVGALGLSGPLAAAAIIAGGLAGRQVKKRISNGRKAGSTGRGGDQPEMQRPIAVDSPPPPQRTVTETHYVSVEKDSFAKAHQWACEQVARKYPGAMEILQALDSLIKQHLAAQ